MNSALEDRKLSPLHNITNNVKQTSSYTEDSARWEKFDESHWFPMQPTVNMSPVPKLPDKFKTQNVHPYLAFYEHDMQTEHLSHKDISTLLAQENEMQLLNFLSEIGVIAHDQQCEFCGGSMHFQKQGNTWYWICTRRVDGVKCNKGKFSIRDGTFFGKSHLPIQTILWMVWHFVHNLTENQCKQYCNLGQKNCKTVGNWYAKCREVCEKWIWANKPKLGGFGKIVEIDDSHFAGTPKYGKGRRNGEDPWDNHFKWTMGLTQRGLSTVY